MKFVNAKKKNCNKPGARAERKTAKLEKKNAKEAKREQDELQRKVRAAEKLQAKEKRNNASLEIAA